MNAVLWVVQGLLAALYAVAGGTKIFVFEKVSDQVASNSAFPREIWTLVGIFELLCALALVIPAAMRKSPILTPVAAALLAIAGVGFSALHYSYAEYAPMTVSLILTALTAFVAYGRFVVKPL